MKKLIFTANMIAIIALVPALVFGYLHNNGQSKQNKANTEMATDVANGQNDDGTILHLVKSF